MTGATSGLKLPVFLLFRRRRVGEEVAPLAPHRPERALLTHSVLHARVWFQVVYRWTILAAGRG
jgi:hypothetical protein